MAVCGCRGHLRGVSSTARYWHPTDYLGDGPCPDKDPGQESPEKGNQRQSLTLLETGPLANNACRKSSIPVALTNIFHVMVHVGYWSTPDPGLSRERVVYSRYLNTKVFITR